MALNRAAILLLSAHLEGYLEDVMEEALAAIHNGLAPKPLVQTLRSPSTGNIDRLFSFLGMNEPCDAISWQKAGNSAVKRNINNLVATRNRIAHGATGVEVYKSQVERHRKYVVGFAQRFDARVRARVQALTGAAPW